MSEKMKFEEAMQRLECEVKKLESGSMAIDDALASFEEAVRLVKICNDRLVAAESRVRVLTESSDGVVTDAPFALGKDEA